MSMTAISRDAFGTVSGEPTSREGLRAAVATLKYAAEHLPLARLSDGGRLLALVDAIEAEVDTVLVVDPGVPWESEATARRRRMMRRAQ